MLKNIQDIDFQSVYCDFLDTFPASRQAFVQKRLWAVCRKKITYKSPNWLIQWYLAMPKDHSQLTSQSDSQSCEKSTEKPTEKSLQTNQPKPYPVIIYNRGWNTHQTVNWKKPWITPKELFFRMGYFAQQWYLVVWSNYSWGYQSAWRDEFWWSDLEDIVSLYDLLPDREYADAKSVGMLWFSRWWMMSYLSMKDDRFDLKAVVTVWGVADLVAMQEDRPAMLEKVFIPCFWWSKKAMIARSALNFVDKLQDIPLLLLHGCDDTRVSFQQSLNLLQRGVDGGKTIQGVFYAWWNHQLTTHMNESFSAMKSRFDKYLQ